MYLSQAAPALYALALPRAAGDDLAALEFCRDTGFLGVGWGVGSLPLDWESYRQRAIARDGRIDAAVLELHDLPDGSLIWTRDPDRQDFYLARVCGPWQYLHSPAALSVGMQNVRPVRMLACASSQVPRAIANRFRGDWAIRRIDDEHAAWRSTSLFAKLTGDAERSRPTLDEILSCHLSDEQVRNLVCRYLHWRYGYLRRPPALQPMFGSWEYVLRDANGAKAIVRARRGFSIVPRGASQIPAGVVDRIFVFSPTGTYSPARDRNVTEIDADAIIDFIREQPSTLPPACAHLATARTQPTHEQDAVVAAAGDRAVLNDMRSSVGV